MSQGYRYTPVDYDTDDSDSDIVLYHFRNLIDELALSIIHSAASPGDAQDVVRSVFDSRQGFLDHTFEALGGMFLTATNAIRNAYVDGDLETSFSNLDVSGFDPPVGFADIAPNHVETSAPELQANGTYGLFHNRGMSNGDRRHLLEEVTAQSDSGDSDDFDNLESQTPTPTAPSLVVGAQNAANVNGTYASTNGDLGGPVETIAPLLPQPTRTPIDMPQRHITQNITRGNGSGVRASEQLSENPSIASDTASTHVQQAFGLPLRPRGSPPWRLLLADGRTLPIHPSDRPEIEDVSNRSRLCKVRCGTYEGWVSRRVATSVDGARLAV